MNALHQSVEETFRTRQVRGMSRDDEEYIGFLDRMDWQQRHVLLHGAERDGEHVGAVYISHAERIELADTDYRVEEIEVSEIHPSPYAVKEIDPAENQQYIKETHEHGAIKSWPVVRRNEDDSYECVDGHKALAICRYAAVETQPCQVVDCDDRTVLNRFAFDHFPLTDDSENDSTTYTDEEIRESIHLMVDHWPKSTLSTIYPVDYNLRRLEIEE